MATNLVDLEAAGHILRFQMVDGWVDADVGRMPAHVLERAVATVDGMIEGLGGG